MNKLIILQVNGGLGNQLFQISNAYNLSLKFNRVLLICNKNKTKRDVYWDSIFSNFKENLIDENDYNKIRSISEIYNWANTRFEYKNIELNDMKYAYCIEGYYQSYKYFDVKTFKEKIGFDKLFFDLRHCKVELNDIAIHIRRGDYKDNNFHKLLKLDYYYNCIKDIKNKTNINKIYVFTDDIKWCKENLEYYNYTYPQYNDVNEMIFMSKFKYIIIANSTFSWWSAYLSEDSIIYSPTSWFIENCTLNTKDLRPSSWVLIDDTLEYNDTNTNNFHYDEYIDENIDEDISFSSNTFNIISLGSACCMVQNIHDNIYNNLGPLYRQPDNATNFFDWVIVDFKSILYIFNNLKRKNDSFLNKNNYTLKDIYSKSNKLIGGWSKVYRKVEHKDCKMLFLHDVKKELSTIPKDFYEKYKRRFERLYDKIVNNESIYFMHCFDFQWLDPYFPSVKEISELIDICNKINSKCSVELIFFIHPKYKNDKNKHIFAEYEVTNNLTLYYLKDNGMSSDWKANNLSWSDYIHV